MKNESTTWWRQVGGFFHFHGSRKRKEERRRQQRRCHVEPLESRALLSVTPQIVGVLDAGYAQTGSGWQTQIDHMAYEGQIRCHAGGDGSDTAWFTFSGLNPTSSYQLYATYDANSANTSNCALYGLRRRQRARHFRSQPAGGPQPGHFRRPELGEPRRLPDEHGRDGRLVVGLGDRRQLRGRRRRRRGGDLVRHATAGPADGHHLHLERPGRKQQLEQPG